MNKEMIGVGKVDDGGDCKEGGGKRKEGSAFDRPSRSRTDPAPLKSTPPSKTTAITTTATTTTATAI